MTDRMHQVLSFQPDRQDIEYVPIEVHNKLIEEHENTKDELVRCRQKVAHLLKEKGEK